MKRLTAAIAIVTAVGLTGCGFDVQSPDLFLLTRTGQGTKLTLLVNYGGTISCNGAKPRQISDAMLITARDLSDNLADDGTANLKIPITPSTVFYYRIKVQQGTISFPDDSARQHSELAQAELFAAHNLISTFQAIVLGILQGATELFPVSSLGHTVLFPTLFRWHNIVAWQSEPSSPWLAFVVMLHVGSAIGLLIYFWRDWLAIIRAFFRTLGKRRIETPNERLAWLIIAATIPVGILGLVLERPVRDALAKPLAAALFLIVNGCILLAGERYRQRADVRQLAAREGLNAEGARRLESMEYREAGLIGVAQSTALIAGISRDGVCMTAGLARGLDNADAAHFGFLLATPPILLAGLLKLSELTGPHGDGGVRGASVVAAVFAAVTAIITVHFLTGYFKTKTLKPFGIYCLLFGAFMVLFTLVVGTP